MTHKRDIFRFLFFVLIWAIAFAFVYRPNVAIRGLEYKEHQYVYYISTMIGLGYIILCFSRWLFYTLNKKRPLSVKFFYFWIVHSWVSMCNLMDNTFHLHQFARLLIPADIRCLLPTTETHHNCFPTPVPALFLGRHNPYRTCSPCHNIACVCLPNACTNLLCGFAPLLRVSSLPGMPFLADSIRNS